MSDDPFSLPPADAEAPRFEEAVQGAVERLRTAVAEFEAFLREVPAEAFSEDEWAVIDAAAADIEKSAEMAEDGYVAVMFDSHAWYRIMEHLQRVVTRLQSASGMIRSVRERVTRDA